MPKSRIPSPARSQSGVVTPRRHKPRGSRSVGSPARSNASGRLTSVIDQFKEKNFDSFALSPINNRRSVLTDNTDIEEPRRKSWWKNLNENSRDVMELLEEDKATAAVDAIEDIVDIEVLSQEKKNYTLDLPESSDNESINSIVLPQRRLFTQKENHQKMFGQLVGGRETLAKLHKSGNNTYGDKTIVAGTKELFQGTKRTKPIFPAALLNISANKTAADKTKENVAAEPKVPVRNIFGNRPANKRKNMFADFVVSESEDEISEIQPKVFGFQKKVEQRRISSISKGRDYSPTSSVMTDIELDDDWKHLPSSTMVENQLDEIVGTPIKRARLSKLAEVKDAVVDIVANRSVDSKTRTSPGAKDATVTINKTVDKTRQSNKSANKTRTSPRNTDASKLQEHNKSEKTVNDAENEKEPFIEEDDDENNLTLHYENDDEIEEENQVYNAQINNQPNILSNKTHDTTNKRDKSNINMKDSENKSPSKTAVNRSLRSSTVNKSHNQEEITSLNRSRSNKSVKNISTPQGEKAANTSQRNKSLNKSNKSVNKSKKSINKTDKSLNKSNESNNSKLNNTKTRSSKAAKVIAESQKNDQDTAGDNVDGVVQNDESATQENDEQQMDVEDMPEDAVQSSEEADESTKGEEDDVESDTSLNRSRSNKSVKNITTPQVEKAANTSQRNESLNKSNKSVNKSKKSINKTDKSLNKSNESNNSKLNNTETRSSKAAKVIAESQKNYQDTAGDNVDGVVQDDESATRENDEQQMDVEDMPEDAVQSSEEADESTKGEEDDVESDTSLNRSRSNKSVKNMTTPQVEKAANKSQRNKSLNKSNKSVNKSKKSINKTDKSLNKSNESNNSKLNNTKTRSSKAAKVIAESQKNDQDRAGDNVDSVVQDDESATRENDEQQMDVEDMPEDAVQSSVEADESTKGEEDDVESEQEQEEIIEEQNNESEDKNVSEEAESQENDIDQIEARQAVGVEQDERIIENQIQETEESNKRQETELNKVQETNISLQVNKTIEHLVEQVNQSAAEDGKVNQIDRKSLKLLTQFVEWYTANKSEKENKKSNGEQKIEVEKHERKSEKKEAANLSTDDVSTILHYLNHLNLPVESKMAQQNTDNVKDITIEKVQKKSEKANNKANLQEVERINTSKVETKQNDVASSFLDYINNLGLSIEDKQNNEEQTKERQEVGEVLTKESEKFDAGEVVEVEQNQEIEANEVVIQTPEKENDEVDHSQPVEEDDEVNQSNKVEEDDEVNQSEEDEEVNQSEEAEKDEVAQSEEDEEGNQSEEAEEEDEVDQSQEVEVDDEVNESQEVEEDDENNQSQEVEEEDGAAQSAEEESDDNESQEVEAEVEESEQEEDENDHDVTSHTNNSQEQASDDEADASQEIENDENDSDDNEDADENNQSVEDHETDDSANADQGDGNNKISEDNQEQMEVDDEGDNHAEEIIEESPNITHDTTGRNRKKVKSPEVILLDKTNQQNSFMAKGRNTSIRKTKSMYKDLNIRPSLAPARDSLGLSDGTKDSSAEGSGWDSHRTTRKTLRQTFGKDFTPRKSLRTLVMEKSAKQNQHIETLHSETVKFPQANSTELPDDSNRVDDVSLESNHEVSLRTRQTTLETYLQKMKEQNMEKKRKMEEAVRNSLQAPSNRDALSLFKVPSRPAPRKLKSTTSKPAKTQSKCTLFGELPPEVIQDMKYKPPRRFQPANASWITKRLYKHLETKLEPKYDYKARVRAEKLVETIYVFVKELRRHSAAPPRATDSLAHELARLGVVTTHYDFYQFFHEYMPREVRVKVVPDVVNNIPLPRHGVFEDILRGNTEHG